MFKQLRGHCKHNNPHKVKVLLDANPGIDVTEDDGAPILLTLALYNNDNDEKRTKSTQILEYLLQYFRASLPEDHRSNEYSAPMHRMLAIFDEYIDFEDLSPEMREIICDYLPLVAKKGLMDRAANGDIDIVRELYPHFQDVTNEILETATTHTVDVVVDAVADMQATKKQTAMIFCDAADLYSKSGKLEKAQSFYVKAIKADPHHIMSYLHFANMIAAHLYTSGTTFDPGDATKAEDCYNKVIEYNQQYSCAHKKLGILYQTWSQHNIDNKQEFEIKALESYIRAIECKNPKLQYDALYHEITHLILTNIHHPKVQEIISNNSTYNDARLQQELVALGTSRQNPDTLDAISHPSSGSEDGGISSLLDEDIEYEEWDMDRDLDSSNTSELSFIGQQVDQFADIV